MQKVPAHLGDGEFRTIMVEESGIVNYLKPTATELNNTSNLDLSYYLSATGWHLTHSQDMIDDDRESSAAVGQIPGQEKYSDGSMDLIDNVNTPDGGTHEEGFRSSRPTSTKPSTPSPAANAAGSSADAARPYPLHSQPGT